MRTQRIILTIKKIILSVEWRILIMNKFKLWKERHYTSRGHLYIQAHHEYVNGVIGKDIDLTLWQKIQILFGRGISVFFIGGT
jgi:hypothetical protein